MKRHLFISVFILLISGYAFSQSAVKHILLEEFSTAPCGFCPDGDIIAEQLIKDHPNVIWLTHHAGFGTDSLTVPESNPIANAFTTFAPGACIDRGDYPIPIYTMPPYIAVSRQRWDSVCVAHLNDPPVADIKITNAYNSVSRSLNCTIDASFITTPASGDLRLNLFIVEDSVVGFGKGFDQTNYFNTTPGHPCYQKGDPIVGYIHRRVLRSVPTGAWGSTGIIPSSPAAGKTYSYTFANIPISPKWKENDIDVIAFVSYYNTNAKLRQVINSNQKKLKDTTTTTGLPSVNVQNPGVSVFPNPASNKVILRYDLKDDTNNKIVITDRQGKTIKSFTLEAANNTSVFSVEELPNGIYFYQIITDDRMIHTGKLIIMH